MLGTLSPANYQPCLQQIGMHMRTQPMLQPRGEFVTPSNFTSGTASSQKVASTPELSLRPLKRHTTESTSSCTMPGSSRVAAPLAVTQQFASCPTLGGNSVQTTSIGVSSTQGTAKDVMLVTQSPHLGSKPAVESAFIGTVHSQPFLLPSSPVPPLISPLISSSLTQSPWTSSPLTSPPLISQAANSTVCSAPHSVPTELQQATPEALSDVVPAASAAPSEAVECSLPKRRKLSAGNSGKDLAEPPAVEAPRETSSIPYRLRVLKRRKRQVCCV